MIQLSEETKKLLLEASKMKTNNLVIIHGLRSPNYLAEAKRYLNVCIDVNNMLIPDHEFEEVEKYFFDFIKYGNCFLVVKLSELDFKEKKKEKKGKGETDEYRIGTEIFETLGINEEYFVSNEFNEKHISTRIRLLCNKHNVHSKFKYKTLGNGLGGNFKRYRTIWDK